MKDVDIEYIISKAQRRVKRYSDKDKKEFDEQDSNDLNWIEQFLASDTSPKIRNTQPEPEMRWAIRDVDRRVAEQDFRERFPSETSEETESRTKKSFEKALRKIAQSYSRSLKLVE